MAIDSAQYKQARCVVLPRRSRPRRTAGNPGPSTVRAYDSLSPATAPLAASGKPATGGRQPSEAWFQRRSVQRLAATLVACLACLMPAASSPAHDPTGGAEQFLREEKGLRLLESSQVWVTPLEIRLRRRLLQMQKLEVRIRAAQRELEDGIATNGRLWRVQQARVAQIQKELQGLSKGDPDRKRLEGEWNRLKQQASPPEQLGGRQAVQAQVVALINDRNDLTAALFWVRDGAERLEAEYRELAADQRVHSRLQQLGANHQLGPDKDYSKQARKYEPLVLTDWVPLYRQSDRLRFCLLVRDRIPLTFSWREDDGPTLVTFSMLERLGLQLPPDAPRVEQQVGKRRVLTTRVTLPPLRAGRWVFLDMEAYVLPAEAEDVGAMLGRAACGKLTVRVEPEQLRIVWSGAD